MQLARGGWKRAAVIRGDVTTVGVVLVVSAVASLAAAVVDGAPSWLPLASIPLAVAGAALVVAGRRGWRQLLVEAAARHVDFDPGPSPVAWIDEVVWRSRNRFDPPLDAPTLLWAEVDPLVPTFGQDATGAFTEPTLRVVTTEERALATPSDVDATLPVPPESDAVAALASLVGTPGRFIAVAPRWPVCCARLTTLEAIGADVDVASLFVLPREPGADAPSSATHAFRCRACGRRYGTDPAW